jgi:hypothetical protein
MTKFILAAAIAAAIVLFGAAARAQNRPTFSGSVTPVAIYPAGVPLGFVSIPVSGSAVDLEPPTGATFALISASGANVNWRDDGTAPTASVGMPIIAGQAPIALANLPALKFIAQSGTAALNVSFYK